MTQTDGDPLLFVSHHSSKYDLALSLEAALAKRGIKCWIAPRDVDPGEPFDKSVGNAIRDSAAILLMFCARSDRSRHVKRELILGDSAGRPIIPLRLEAIDPGDLAYHLADSQWIDWIDRREAVIDRVAAQARYYGDATMPAAGPGSQPHREGGWFTRLASRKSLIVAAVIASVLAVAAIVWLATNSGSDGESPPATAEKPPNSIEQAEAAGEEAGIVDAEAGPAADATTARRSSASPVMVAPQPAAPRTQPAQPQPAPVASSQRDGPLVRTIDACRGAATDTEYLICADPALDRRAGEIGTLYRQARSMVEQAGGDGAALQREQRAWLNTVKASCHSAGCVAAAQQQRISELRGLIARGG